MAQNLTELKDELYDAFNRAMTTSHNFYRAARIHEFQENTAVALQALTAASRTATALVNVEHALAEQRQNQELEKSPRRSVSPA